MIGQTVYHSPDVYERRHRCVLLFWLWVLVTDGSGQGIQAREGVCFELLYFLDSDLDTPSFESELISFSPGMDEV